MSKRAIIFDFDGTIADSERVMLRIYRNLAARKGKPKLSHRSYVKLRSAQPREIQRWAGVRFWQLPGLLRMGRKEYQKYLDDIRIFPYMPDVIRRLAASGADVYVLSSNEQSSVNKVLSKIGLDADVKTMHGSPLFGKHKIIKKIIRKNSYDPNLCWMVGDEVRDIEAGKKAGVNTVAVAWGLQSKAGLKQARPDHIAEKPQEVLSCIKSALVSSAGPSN